MRLQSHTGSTKRQVSGILKPTANITHKVCRAGIPQHISAINKSLLCTCAGHQIHASNYQQSKNRSLTRVQAAAEVQDIESNNQQVEDDDDDLKELSTAQHIITEDSFAPDLVKELRAVFDERFSDPRRIHSERFMWDHWWCPDAEGTCQYHLVRTQAQVYFGAELHDKLVDVLLAYSESHLGCRAITPIWMSYYTDGMVQELHCDNPHGPFAFVLSLTNWEGREFIGGETRIMKPAALDYWNRPAPEAGLEHCHLVTLVPPLFGRLTVFDPRFPHGVRQVQGTKDPRKGRLVLHGWFTEPAPFFTGGLSEEEATPVLNETLGSAIESLQETYENEDGEEVVSPGSHPCSGILTLRIHVDGHTGSVKEVAFLADTLVPTPSLGVDPAQVRAAIQRELHTWFMDAEFPVSSKKEDTFITLPVVFE